MPELPEVEIVRRGLDDAMRHKRIVAAEIKRFDLRIPIPVGFRQAVTGQRLEKMSRRGKYILAHLSNGLVIIIHLGMSGRFTILTPGPSHRDPDPHDQGCVMPGAFVHKTAASHEHVQFELEDGTQIVYSDPRRFGLMTLADEKGLGRHPLLAAMGPEPLNVAFDEPANEPLTGPRLLQRLQNRKTPIKSALLDQKVIAGLGNIYVCEALFAAGISPRRLAKSIGPRRAARLAQAITTVLTDALRAGGSSLRDYAHTDGSLGYFQHAFKVYDREGENCANTGCTNTVARIVQASRSTFFCSACQR